MSDEPTAEQLNGLLQAQVKANVDLAAQLKIALLRAKRAEKLHTKRDAEHYNVGYSIGIAQMQDQLDAAIERSDAADWRGRALRAEAQLRRVTGF